MTAEAKALATKAQAPLVEAPALDPVLQMISDAARDPSVDVEKMRALLDMRREAEADQAKRMFAAAMSEAKAEMPAVVRDAENKETHSKWARLETVAAAIDPILVKYGFSISYGTYDAAQEGHYGITAMVRHKAGHSEEYRAPVPADLTGPKGNVNKSKTHAFGSTMSYGRRYLKLMIFDVVTKGEDDDGDAASTEFVTTEQAIELQELVKKVGGKDADFLGWIKATNYDRIPAAKYERAKKECLDAIALKKAKK